MSEHRWALKKGDVQAFTLAEHVLETGHAVDLSKTVVLDQHQHTTLPMHAGELAHPAQPDNLE